MLDVVYNKALHKIWRLGPANLDNYDFTIHIAEFWLFFAKIQKNYVFKPFLGCKTTPTKRKASMI